jgi:hypothetical protein
MITITIKRYIVSLSQLYYDNHIWLHVSTFQVNFRPSKLIPLTNSQYIWNVSSLWDPIWLYSGCTDKKSVRSLECNITVGLWGRCERYRLNVCWDPVNDDIFWLTARLLSWIQVFRDVTVCHWVCGSQRFEGFEDDSVISFLRSSLSQIVTFSCNRRWYVCCAVAFYTLFSSSIVKQGRSGLLELVGCSTIRKVFLRILIAYWCNNSLSLLRRRMISGDIFQK